MRFECRHTHKILSRLGFLQEKFNAWWCDGCGYRLRPRECELGINRGLLSTRGMQCVMGEIGAQCPFCAWHIGPITAFTLKAFVSDLSQFRNGREFAAWIGLTPRQDSTGGREQLGGITTMGQKDLCFVLVQGAMSLYYHKQKNFKELSPQLQHMITTEKPKVICLTWANKTACVLWALAVKGEDDRWASAS
ncbi:MAG: transposase [Gammaproteobacteria bacterium]|nr:transposase [Gammaproteobacteria bacterium]